MKMKKPQLMKELLQIAKQQEPYISSSSIVGSSSSSSGNTIASSSNVSGGGSSNAEGEDSEEAFKHFMQFKTPKNLARAELLLQAFKAEDICYDEVNSYHQRHFS